MRNATRKYLLPQLPEAAAPHIGHMIKTHLTSIGLTGADVGRSTDRNGNTVRALLQQPSTQTAIVWELCHALKHNFFADLAAQLPEDYKSEAQSTLAAENAALKAELAVMERLLGKKG